MDKKVKVAWNVEIPSHTRHRTVKQTQEIESISKLNNDETLNNVKFTYDDSKLASNKSNSLRAYIKNHNLNLTVLKDQNTLYVIKKKETNDD